MLIQAIRKIWLWSPERREALRFVKEGKLYRCRGCSQLFAKLVVDHIEPVIPVQGSSGWDEYIARTFVPPHMLNPCCKSCHATKTKHENQLRKAHKKLIEARGLGSAS